MRTFKDNQPIVLVQILNDMHLPLKIKVVLKNFRVKKFFKLNQPDYFRVLCLMFEIKLFNVKASIVHSLSAPLLLGQSALSKFGKIEFDYAKSTLTIFGGPNDYLHNNSNDGSYLDISGNYSSNESVFKGNYLFQTTFENSAIDIILRRESNVSSIEVYLCPKNSIVYE